MSVICPACAKENISPDALFCSWCGASLRKDGAKELFEKIRDIYIEYINWGEFYLAERSAGSSLSALFTGDRAFKERPEHTKFYSSCGETAEKLLTEIKAGEAVSEEFFDLMKFVLIDCHIGRIDSVEWMLLAAEKHFLPFVELLGKAQAAELLEPYRRARRKNKGLPPQDDMLKRLKKCAK